MAARDTGYRYRGRGPVINRNAIEPKYKFTGRTDGRTDENPDGCFVSIYLYIYIYTCTYVYMDICLMVGSGCEALQKRGSESGYQGSRASGRLIQPRLFIENRRDSGTRRHDGKLGGEGRERDRERERNGGQESV